MPAKKRSTPLRQQDF
jgi:hypothetical protein